MTRAAVATGGAVVRERGLTWTAPPRGGAQHDARVSLVEAVPEYDGYGAALMTLARRLRRPRLGAPHRRQARVGGDLPTSRRCPATAAAASAGR
jgi:hypothetical protein